MSQWTFYMSQWTFYMSQWTLIKFSTTLHSQFNYYTLSVIPFKEGYKKDLIIRMVMRNEHKG